MNPNVLVTVKGLQHEYGETSPTEIETIQPGTYKSIQDKHIVIYEEPCDYNGQSSQSYITNLLKISPGSVSLTKRGHTSVDMFFKKGHHHSGTYETAYGALSLPVDIITSSLEITENTDCIDIKINYSLEFDHSYISSHTIYINIHSV